MGRPCPEGAVCAPGVSLPGSGIGGTSCRNRTLRGSRGKRSVAELCPSKARHTFSRARGSCQPHNSAYHSSEQGEQDPIQAIAAPQGLQGGNSISALDPAQGPLHPHCSMPLVNVSAPLPALLPECPPLPQPRQGLPQEAPSSSEQLRGSTGLMNLLPAKFNLQPQAEPNADGVSPDTPCCLTEPVPKWSCTLSPSLNCVYSFAFILPSLTPLHGGQFPCLREKNSFQLGLE